MATLEPILQALGYDSAQQRAFIRLLHAAGGLGELPGISDSLNDGEAQAVLTHLTFPDAAAAAHWLHHVTQAHMLRRPPGVERYDCEEPQVFRLNRAELLNNLQTLGMTAEATPSVRHYDHVLVLGAMEDTAVPRIKALRQLHDQGIRFDKIYLLGCQRHLHPEHEFSGADLTETQMMEKHFNAERAHWPKELQQVPAIAVDTFNHAGGSRANTRDTIVSWLNTNPAPGKVLAISSQPHVAYQQAAIRSVLPPGFEVETIGHSASDEKISLYMDALARQIDVGFSQLLDAMKALPAAQAVPGIAQVFEALDIHDPARRQNVAALLARAGVLPQAPHPALVMLNPAAIDTDAATYQFRSGGDGSGVTRTRRYDCDRWDSILHGDPLLVHERLDGRIFVADGHHRLELAKRLNASGNGPGLVAAQVLREADGYSAADARIIAAYKNIARGQTDPVDTAHVLQEARSGRVHAHLLPKLDMRQGNLALAHYLSTLPEQALGMVKTGEVPAELAAQVALRVQAPAHQMEVMHVLRARLQQTGFLARLEKKQASPPERGM